MLSSILLVVGLFVFNLFMGFILVYFGLKALASPLERSKRNKLLVLGSLGYCLVGSILEISLWAINKYI